MGVCMKQGRALGKDRPNGEKQDQKLQFQGVKAQNFPEKNLNVSLDDMLSGINEETTSVGQQFPDTSKIHSGEILLKGEHPQSDYENVPCDHVDVSPFQPRLDFNEEELELLAQSIAAAGRVNRPIIVRKKANGRYELIGGERRWRAVVQLGWSNIPARIVDVDDAEAQVLAISDNEGQQGPSDFESGLAYQKALDSKAIPSARALATRIAVSHPTVLRRIALTKLPPACIEFLKQYPKTLGVKLATEFVAAGETHPDLVLEALVKIDQEGISQEQALKWIHASIKGSGAGQTKSAKRTHECVLPGGLRGEMTISGSALKIKVPKGVDMEKLEGLILAALAES